MELVAQPASITLGNSSSASQARLFLDGFTECPLVIGIDSLGRQKGAHVACGQLLGVGQLDLCDVLAQPPAVNHPPSTKNNSYQRKHNQRFDSIKHRYGSHISCQ